eukprot:CAMPEP_0205920808 /NCGR_PEP_ID=MMETSP1325-20131115/11791_1 /ASSEMBLY_ACC=CAM_ASM_000708 /TAXON_ID=236786 /ORGANISM="Florenciella sp., Strain RCC1007" /LENGTH=55 /DNA_ID=CAMNT_0053288537 /DNA_START=67 /DNA_END=234 /DNA_ORIENTATION=+
MPVSWFVSCAWAELASAIRPSIDLGSAWFTSSTSPSSPVRALMHMVLPSRESDWT